MNRCYALSRRAFQGRANGDLGAFADLVVVAVWPGVRLYLVELGGSSVMHVSDARSADVGTRDRGRFGLWLVFGSAGDGVFNSSDAEWANFKVMVTNDNGSRTAHTLASLGITEIDLNADAVNFELPDGLFIYGGTTSAYTVSSAGTVEGTAVFQE